VDLGPFEYGASLVTGVGGEPLPVGFRLLAVAPNPTRSGSRIRFTIPSTGAASLALFDLSGRRIRTLAEARFEAGPAEIVWDGRDASGRPVGPGMYFLRLGWDRFVDGRKVLVVR